MGLLIFHRGAGLLENVRADDRCLRINHSERKVLCFLAFCFRFSADCDSGSVSVFVAAGYRHPSPTTVARTVRILHTLLALISKHLKCDKFEVNTQSVAYLAGMYHRITPHMKSV